MQPSLLIPTTLYLLPAPAPVSCSLIRIAAKALVHLQTSQLSSRMSPFSLLWTSSLSRSLRETKAAPKMGGFYQARWKYRQRCFFPGSELKSGEPKVGQRCSYFLAPSKRDRSQIVAVDVTALP